MTRCEKEKKEKNPKREDVDTVSEGTFHPLPPSVTYFNCPKCIGYSTFGPLWGGEGGSFFFFSSLNQIKIRSYEDPNLSLQNMGYLSSNSWVP